MAIYRLLQTAPLSPEDISVLTDAYERTLRALRLVDRNDPITEMVAKKIIELGQRGVREADELSALAMAELGVDGKSKSSLLNLTPAGARRMDDKQKTEMRDRLRHCPACAAELVLTYQFLDPRHGKTIRLLKCEKCGERTWDD